MQDFEITLSVFVSGTAVETLMSFFASDSSLILLRTLTGNQINAVIRDATGNSVSVTISSVRDVWHTVTISWDATNKKATITDGVLTSSNSNTSISNGAFTSAELGRWTSHGESKQYNLKIWVEGVLKLQMPLQGSCYDVSGNGNHGKNNGCDLTTVQDDFHYNLRKGFGNGENVAENGFFQDWTANNPDDWAVIENASNQIEESANGCRFVGDGSVFLSIRQNTATVGSLYNIKLVISDYVEGALKVNNSSNADVFDNISAVGTYEKTMVFNANKIEIGRRLPGVAVDITVESIEVRPIVPRLADNSGFAVAVDEEHLAGTWNNMPEGYFRFPTTLSDNIMDKSNVNIWSSDIRASVHYDSAHKGDWHSSELVQAYLDDNINPTYKNRIFVADNNTTFIKDGGSFITDSGAYVVELGSGATESKQILIYSTEQTGEALEKIIKYLEGQY